MEDPNAEDPTPKASRGGVRRYALPGDLAEIEARRWLVRERKNPIHPAVRATRRWLVAKLQDGKKPPVGTDGNPQKEWNAPENWLDYYAARTRRDELRQRFPGETFGLGLVVGDGVISGIDLDHCRDKDSGVLKPQAEAVLSLCGNTYAEVSVSGEGIKVFGLGDGWLELNFATAPPTVERKPLGYFWVTEDAIPGHSGFDELPLGKVAAYFAGSTAHAPGHEPRASKPRPLPSGGGSVAPGGQEAAMFREASALRNRGWEEKEIAEALFGLVKAGRFPSEPGREPWGLADCAEKARSACRYPKGEQTEDKDPLTDPGNAEHFARRYRDSVLYDADRKRWLLFENGRWQPDGLSGVRLKVLESLRARQQAALSSSDVNRGNRVKSLLASENRLPQILGAAEPYLATRATDWDANLWIVGAPNGTVDLRTGEVRPGVPEDRVTKWVSAPWDKNARSTLWDRVLEHALPDAEVRRFLQQLAGLTLAGQTGENVLPLIYGVTRSSKGTVLDAIKTALGDYAKAADLSTLAKKRFEDGGAPRPDLVDLVGARLVAIYEAGRAVKLDTALVKSLSGSDPIKARTLNEKPIEFTPTFLIWLATDTRPEAPHDDAAFFERLCEIPFNFYVPAEKRDPDIRAKLKLPEHGAAVLAWAWHGLRAYLETKRLTRPAAVRAAGREFQASMDPISPFLKECCVLDPQAWVSAGNLRAEYERWVKENGVRAMAGKSLGERLRKEGCETQKRGGERGWRGVGFLRVVESSPLPEREPGGDDVPF